MRAFWYGDAASADPKDRNWGDIVTPVLLRGLTGQTPSHAPRGGGRILAVGSILHRARPGDIIWGSGIISPKHVPECAAALDVRAVRGPLTRNLLAAAGARVPEVYGDPALLAPFFFDVSGISKTHDIGVIPHYSDLPAVKHLAAAEIKVIDICAGLDEVVREVASCRSILASSLHGLVLGDCFAERAGWLRVNAGTALVGHSFKFKDYLQGTGRPPVATDMAAGTPLPTARWLPRPQVDLDALVRACPRWNGTPLDRLPRRGLQGRGS